MNSAFLASFNCLDKIYSDRAFSSIELNKTLMFAKNSDKALVTKIVYGVLDKSILLDWIVSQFSSHTKPKIKLLLKMGTYILKYLSIPVYATVNDVVEISKTFGRQEVVGFVNATLKKISLAVAEDKIVYPDDADEAFCIKNSYPLWAFKKLKKDFGQEEAEKIVECVLPTKNTVRINTAKISVDDFLIILSENHVDFEKTPFDDALYIGGKLDVDTTLWTYQSLSSMFVVRALNVEGSCSVLDACAAPGGKSVYIKTLDDLAEVKAVDIYPHRVDLIKSYAERMGVQIDAEVGDSTVFVPDWENKFDFVLCDVPCSGFGVLDNHPDIKLFRQSEDLPEILKAQRAILSNCSRYVKSGGVLVYSTCTVFANENSENVSRFLKANEDFMLEKIPLDKVNDGMYQFVPQNDGTQGFFIARMRKK